MAGARVAVSIERLPDGSWRAHAPWPPYNDCVAYGDTREQALDRIRSEITYRMEFCPCSTVPPGFVELEVQERA